MPQTAKNTLQERVIAIAERAAVREGLELWDAEVLGAGRSRLVRIYIDKPEGVTLGDCELISQQVGTVLDVEDVIPDNHYHLEVSSPGLERRLFKLDHFVRFTGQKAMIALKEPVGKQRRWEGILGGVEGDLVLFETAAGPMQLRMDQIDKANLKFEW